MSSNKPHSSLCLGLFVLAAACSSSNNSTGTGDSGGGSSATSGGASSTGGDANVGEGGAAPSGNGGSPSSGGETSSGAGGTTQDTDGGGGASSGGVPSSGGGAQGGGGAHSGGSTSTGGTTGGVPLAVCDGTKESSAHPITQACGSFVTPTGATLKLGPYGASMDVNVGKGFENPDPMDNPTCPVFVAAFNEGSALSNQLLDDGTQPCTSTTPNAGDCINFQLYTVFRPANWPPGKIPVLTWGNGTCAQPEGYGALLRYVASYGFLVVAANSRETGNGADLQKAIDYVTAANQDATSPYYGHLDLTKVGAMGHSQGSGAAASATEADARIKSAIFFNLTDAITDSKPYLAISGDLDIAGFTAASMSTAINSASGPAAYLYYHNPAGSSSDGIRGHLVLMLSPERVAPAAVAWWQMEFESDATAKKMFVGSSCGLCGHSSDYDYGEKGL